MGEVANKGEGACETLSSRQHGVRPAHSEKDSRRDLCAVVRCMFTSLDPGDAKDCQIPNRKMISLRKSANSGFKSSETACQCISDNIPFLFQASRALALAERAVWGEGTCEALTTYTEVCERFLDLFTEHPNQRFVQVFSIDLADLRHRWERYRRVQAQIAKARGASILRPRSICAVHDASKPCGAASARALRDGRAGW